MNHVENINSAQRLSVRFQSRPFPLNFQCLIDKIENDRTPNTFRSRMHKRLALMGVGGKGIEDVVDANTVKKHFEPEITPLDEILKRAKVIK